MKELERRAYSCEMRAEQTERGNRISGRPIVYNQRTNIGFYDEIIASGALNGTNLRDVRLLVNHNTDMIPLARSRRNNGKSTMQLIPNELGLDIDAVLDTENNTDARSLYSAVERGDISGMSFLFSVDDEEWENLESDHPTRIIRSIGSVVEVSAVTFPAYDATEIEARSKEALDNARSALESARQQKAETLDSGLKLAKEKTKLLGGM